MGVVFASCWLVVNMKVFVFLALFIALFGLVVADHATPDDDDEIPSGTFGPPIEAPHPVRYYVGKPPQTFRAPRLTVESVYEAPVEYTTQTVTVFSGFFSPSEFSSGAPTISVAIFLVIATLALVF